MSLFAELKTELYGKKAHEHSVFDIYQQLFRKIANHPGFVVQRRLNFNAAPYQVDGAIPIIYGIFDGITNDIDSARERTIYRLAEQAYKYDTLNPEADSEEDKAGSKLQQIYELYDTLFPKYGPNIAEAERYTQHD